MWGLVKLVVGGWVVWRLIGPEVSGRYPPGQVRPTRIPGRTVFVGEEEFFVRETGLEDGPTIVLIHGWSLDGELTFHRLIPLLASRFRVVIPDHRNHGRSAWIRGRFELAQAADELAAVLDAVGVARATLFGWSMGGMIAQELTRRQPLRVDRLILGGTAARPIPRLRMAARVLFWLGRAIARISTREMSLISTEIMVRTGAIGQEHRRWMINGLMRRDASLYYEAAAAVWRFDSRDWVGKLGRPALVIIPTEDQLVPPAAQYELAELMEGVEVLELVGGRHEAILNRADEIAKAVSGFVL